MRTGDLGRFAASAVFMTLLLGVAYTPLTSSGDLVGRRITIAA